MINKTSSTLKTQNSSYKPIFRTFLEKESLIWNILMIRNDFAKKKFAGTYILGLTILLWKSFGCNRHNVSENTEIVMRTKAPYFQCWIDQPVGQ